MIDNWKEWLNVTQSLTNITTLDIHITDHINADRCMVSMDCQGQQSLFLHPSWRLQLVSLSLIGAWEPVWAIPRNSFNDKIYGLDEGGKVKPFIFIISLISQCNWISYNTPYWNCLMLKLIIFHIVVMNQSLMRTWSSSNIVQLHFERLISCTIIIFLLPTIIRTRIYVAYAPLPSIIHNQVGRHGQKSVYRYYLV
jgi:hypothetical protein